MNLPPSSRKREALQRNQRALENDEPGTVVLKLDDEHVSPPITAAIPQEALAWRSDTSTGQSQRVQTANVHVEIALLPSWALGEDLSLRGKIQIDNKWFKISSVHRQGISLRIVANRWPEDTD